MMWLITKDNTLSSETKEASIIADKGLEWALYATTIKFQTNQAQKTENIDRLQPLGVTFTP